MIGRLFWQLLGEMDVATSEFDRTRFDFAIPGIANLAVGEEVEQFFALFGRRMIREDVAAKAADEAEPIAQGKIERGFDLAAKALGDGGAFARGGNCDLEIAASNHCGEVKIAVRRIIDRVGEDSPRLCRDKNIAIHGGAAGGCDGEENVREDHQCEIRADAR